MRISDWSSDVCSSDLNPTCVVEPTTWQALSATLLVERSGFGLNELLCAVPRATHAHIHAPKRQDQHCETIWKHQKARSTRCRVRNEEHEGCQSQSERSTDCRSTQTR